MLLSSSPPLFLRFFPFHPFLFCSLTLNGSNNPLHPLIICPILLDLLLLLHIRQESRIFPELPNRTLPFLLELSTQLRCLILLMIGVSLTKIARIRSLKLRNVSWDWDRLVRLKL